MGDIQDESKDKLRSHVYDGIQEYDNMLPRWWVNLFIITTIFAGAYLYYYHFRGEDAGLEQEYRVAKQAADQAALARPNPSQEISEEQLMAMVKDEKILAKGRTIFQEKCVSCHGAHGEGLVGPNFTDRYWIHGGKMKSIVNTIRNGVPAKGMIPWASLLGSDDIHAAAAFVKSLEGTNAPHGKAPEGQLE